MSMLALPDCTIAMSFRPITRNGVSLVMKQVTGAMTTTNIDNKFARLKKSHPRAIQILIEFKPEGWQSFNLKREVVERPLSQDRSDVSGPLPH